MDKRCVCIRQRDKMCKAQNEGGFFCTRKKGHTGEHVACGGEESGMHKLAIWKYIFEEFGYGR